MSNLPTGRQLKFPKAMTPSVILVLLSFLFGCLSSTTILLNVNLAAHEVNPAMPGLGMDHSTELSMGLSKMSPLQNIRILVAIAAFDFSQVPHFEEVIDAYQDLCVTGAAKVDVVVHATVPYPVAYLDLLNSRLVPACRDIFRMTIILVPSSLRLHLVDCHRPMFYEKIDEYDLFIYTEDDIRMSPRTVAAYLDETQRVAQIVGKERASDFNVGIVRYEYNFPSNVVMDDKTRHATQNVTRVYWEHSMFPPVPKAAEAVPADEFKNTHVHMRNHHQGMFLATRDLLLAWKTRPGCEFDKVRDRPGMKNRPSQPSEGTQRVWMSSQMLYGGRHCNVQQLIPVKSFGAFNVLHLPNKNYRRVGHFRNRTFSDGTERFDFGATGSLLTAMNLHIEMQRKMKPKPQLPYRGIVMIDQVNRERSPLLERRMGEYQAYVDRGGVLSDDDLLKTTLVEAQ